MRSAWPSATAKRCCASRRSARCPAPTRRAQLRLEYRGADASANPYLALGAIVRAGLDGVRRRLPAPPILDRDPAELDAEEAARFGVGALPASLYDALQALAADATVRGWMTPLLYDAYVGRQARRARGGRRSSTSTRSAGSMPPSTDGAARRAARRHRAGAAARPSSCATGCTATPSWPTRSSARPRRSRGSCRWQPPRSPGPAG